MKKNAIVLSLAILGLTLIPALTVFASANDRHHGDRMYEVTITNLTRGETFTPILVASHKKRFSLYQLGEPASAELATVAESGNTDPLRNLLLDNRIAYDVVSTGALLPPGESVTVKVKATRYYQYISVASMLIPTNDAFIAVNGIKVHRGHKMISVMSPAYDAGSEMNDELCANIPGPTCGGEGLSDAEGEGYVHIHAGIHGVGDLVAADYDWRNPTAKITIKRMK